MFIKEREEKILELIDKNSAVKASELSELFGISLETVRKDLLSMESRGLLMRVHGGAMKKSGMTSYAPLNERVCEHSDEKRELARRALEFISEGDSIAVDAGSTAMIFAEELAAEFERLTVVTHCLDVFNILVKKPCFDVILVGGDFLRSENSFVGGIAIDILKNLYVKSSFICPSAISLAGGIADFQRDMALIQKAVISISDNVFILADNRKFEKNALLKISDMKKTYTYVTDKGLSAELYNLYTEEGYKIKK